MDEVKFKNYNRNPLTELSELRFEFSPLDQDFELKCLLRFGIMHFEHKDREYEVGVTRADLRLLLEGCETVLGSALNESELETVVEEDSFEVETIIGAEASFSANSSTGGEAKVKTDASSVGTHKLRRSQNKVHMPVTARPGDSWEVRQKSVAGQKESLIEGTAILSERLCAIRRKQGGNRIAVIGEVQVSKSAFRVSAKAGNKLAKAMSEYQNKDAIVSQVLKKAIQREAAAHIPGRISAVMSVSCSEVLEE